MALALIVIGLVVALLLHFWVGIALLLVGVVLLFVPVVPGGYRTWHDRRGPPA